MAFRILSPILFALAAVGCSGGSSSEPAASAEPVISCTSAGVCTTFAPGTTAAEIEAATNPPTTPAPAPSAPTVNGKAYTARLWPNHFYTGEGLVCLVRSDDWNGICAATEHHFAVFSVQARRRISGTQIYELDTGVWRSEVREWSVVDGVLQPAYVVTRVLTSNGFNARLADRSRRVPA